MSNDSPSAFGSGFGTVLGVAAGLLFLYCVASAARYVYNHADDLSWQRPEYTYSAGRYVGQVRPIRQSPAYRIDDPNADNVPPGFHVTHE
jgi:hypothetical protein